MGSATRRTAQYGRCFRATAVFRTRTCPRSRVICLRSGCRSRAAGLQWGLDVWLPWLEAGVMNGCFLVHAPRPLIEASIEMAAQPAPSRGSCHRLVEAA
jgi:hypothetical protein